MDFIDVTNCAEKINKGEKAFTSSLEVRDYIVNWYKGWGTKIETETNNEGFLLWNPEKLNT